MQDDVNLTVSQVFAKDGEKYAFVSFSQGQRVAEGKIPDCKIISNKGFTEEEVSELENYMQNELAKLKRMAAGIRLLDAFMK